MSQKWQFHTKFFVPPYQFGRVGICAARPRCLRCGKCYTPGGTPRRIFRRSRRKRSIALFSSTKPRDWKTKNRFHPFLGQDARRTSQSSGQSQNAARAAADEVETISFSSDFRRDWFQTSNVEKIHQNSCCSSSSSLVIWSAAAPSSVWKHTHTSTFLVICSPLPPPVLPSTSLWCSQLSQNMCSCGRCRSAALESTI